MVVFKQPLELNSSKKSITDRGYGIRYINGNEHPNALLHDILYGNHMLAGKPHAIAHENLVYAVINSEDEHSEDDCLRAINLVRAKQRRRPVKPHVY